MPLAAADQYPVWLNALIFAAAGVAVWLAGTRLTRYVDGVAEKTGIGRAFAGMLLLGGITALPEVASSVTASAIGNPALAANNMLGSASINVLLLAAADAFIGRNALTSFVAGAATLMQAALSMIVLALVAVAILTGDRAIGGVGAWSLAICAAAVAAFWLAARYESAAPWTPARGDGPSESSPDQASGGDRQDVHRLAMKTAIAGAVILGAGYVLTKTGDALATQSGIGTGMVGFALVGTATSLPELSTIVTGLRLRRADMAIGEVLGSNFINVALLLLIDAIATGEPVIARLGAFEVAASLIGVIVTGVLLVGLLERRDPTVLRMGYDSAAILLLFGGGLVVLYSLS